MQKFTAEPSIEVLDRFIKAVVTSSEVTFKVGSKILQLLFETFAFCDLSVKNVLTGYQVSSLNFQYSSFFGCTNCLFAFSGVF